MSDDVETLKDIDDIVDGIMEKATGKDLSECESCRQDKEK
jgi:protoheme ferro-lyase